MGEIHLKDRWYAGRGKIGVSSFKSWYFPAFFLIILLFAFQSPCHAADITDLTGTESILSPATGGTDQVNPAIWDDRIVWAGYYPDPDDPEFFDSDIYLYNVTSGDLKKIPTPLLFQDEPAIWEHLVVWHAWEDDNYEIHLYNLFTEDDQRLTNDAVDQFKPRIWGDWVVWEEGNEEEVYLYNLLTLEKTRLGDVNSSSAKSPAIWEDRVVWEEQRDASSDNLDIFLFNITTRKEMQITTDPFAQTSPSIWGDRIVWQDSRDTSPSVYGKDIGSGEETRIASGNMHCKDPVIYGNFVASVNDHVISLVDLDSMTEKPISTDTTGSSKGYPAIWGDRVVWTDRRNGDFDVFLYTIGTAMPSLDADFTSNVTQGKPPLIVAFTDTSQGQVDGWSWDFGDGTFSSEKNPVHSFDAAGSYTVILTVHNPCQRDAEKKPDLVSVGSVPVPEFSQNRTSGPAPLAVLFTEESSGVPTGWHWDFGDGVISDEKDPVHVYALPGVYSVDLAVSNIFGNASLVKTNLITVMNGTYHACILPSQGITITSEGGVMRLTLNTSEAGICTVDSPDETILTCQPFGDSGIAEIQFMAEAGNRFVNQGDDTITGPLGCVTVQSDDLYPNNFTQKIGENSFYNFSMVFDTYVQGGRIQTVAWEGCTPEDRKRFEDVKIRYDYSNISDLAYSVRFEQEGIQNTGPASLVFAVSSDWVQLYGWSDDRPLKIDANVTDAMVFVDGDYRGGLSDRCHESYPWRTPGENQ